MGLLSSIINFGTFEVLLSDLRKGRTPLSADAADKVLSMRYSRLEEIYLRWITSFMHYHELEKGKDLEATKLRVAPAKWFKTFLFIIMTLGLAGPISTLMFTSTDPEETALMIQVIITAPIMCLGVPFLLGWLYFQFCTEKLTKYSEAQ